MALFYMLLTPIGMSGAPPTVLWNENVTTRPSLIHAEVNPAYAVGGSQYYTLKDAIEHAIDGDTITLLRDFKDKTVVEIDKNITINLQGYTLTRDKTITVNSGKEVTIRGNTGSKLTTGTTDVNTINNQGTLTIDGSVTIEHNGTDTYYYAINNSTAGAILNVKSGTIK